MLRQHKGKLTEYHKKLTATLTTIQQKLKDKVVFQIDKEDPQDTNFIVEAKLENAHNTLVFRTQE